MQKSDEVDVVVVVEIKLLWQNRTIFKCCSHEIITTEKVQPNSQRIHPAYNPVVAGYSHISTS